MKHIALTIMVKDEQQRLSITLESFAPYIQSIIAYDTGSTDHTIQILEKFALEKKLTLHLLEGKFEDFATSRNKLLDYANQIKDVDYLLLVDSNDTIHNGENLLTELKELKDADGYFIPIVIESHYKFKFLSLRLIKPRKGWRYTGVVHEYLYKEKTTDVLVRDETYPCFDNCYFYQNRKIDDIKSSKRWTRDKELLLKEYEKNKTGRVLYYLGATSMLLQQKEEAIKYFTERVQYTETNENVAAQ